MASCQSVNEHKSLCSKALSYQHSMPRLSPPSMGAFPRAQTPSRKSVLKEFYFFKTVKNKHNMKLTILTHLKNVLCMCIQAFPCHVVCVWSQHQVSVLTFHLSLDHGCMLQASEDSPVHHLFCFRNAGSRMCHCAKLRVVGT